MSKKLSETQKLVNKIERFAKSREILEGIRIYFENKAYDYNEFGGEKKVIEDINAEDYIGDIYSEYDIVITFDGSDLYKILNTNNYSKMQNDFLDLLKRNNFSYEFGDSWNMIITKEEK